VPDNIIKISDPHKRGNPPMISRSLFLSALLAASTMFAAPALARSIPPYVAAAVSDGARPAADTSRDADRKPAESIAFAGVKPGDTVLELLAGDGYFTRILSKTVGPRGHIYSTVPDGPGGGATRRG
jgi:predicted methyltransferase